MDHDSPPALVIFSTSEQGHFQPACFVRILIQVVLEHALALALNGLDGVHHLGVIAKAWTVIELYHMVAFAVAQNFSGPQSMISVYLHY